MGYFTSISSDAFQEMQFEAGVLLKDFDPSSPSAPADTDYVCSTTGGITVNCKPNYIDLGEDVDNVPTNTKELKQIKDWTVGLTTTALNVSKDVILLALGAADTSGDKITPRRNLKLTDFTDEIWWVGERTDGGLAAVCIKNVLSSGGFSLKTTKSGKGNLTLELDGHVSLDAQDEVPAEFYVMEGENTAGGTTGGTTGTT